MAFDWQDHKEKEQKKQEMDDSIPSLDERSPRPKVPHCSICGHPGLKKSHLKFSCDFCCTFPRKGCLEKPEGFVCDCSTCDMVNLNSLIAIPFYCWVLVHYIMIGLFTSILIRI